MEVEGESGRHEMAMGSNWAWAPIGNAGRGKSTTWLGKGGDVLDFILKRETCPNYILATWDTTLLQSKG